MVFVVERHIAEGKDGDEAADDAHDKHHDEGEVVDVEVPYGTDGGAGGNLEIRDDGELDGRQDRHQHVAVFPGVVQHCRQGRHIDRRHDRGQPAGAQRSLGGTVKEGHRRSQGQAAGQDGRSLDDQVPEGPAAVQKQQDSCHQRNQEQQQRENHDTHPLERLPPPAERKTFQHSTL